MGKVAGVCKKCGYAHFDWQGCPVPQVHPLTPPKVVVKEFVEKPVKVEKKADRKAYYRDHKRAQRRGPKWALAEVLKMSDISEVHKFVRGFLDGSS